MGSIRQIYVVFANELVLKYKYIILSDISLLNIRRTYMTQNKFNNSIETGSIKKYEDLTISDDFMFGIIMRQAKYCKPFLETVLNIKNQAHRISKSSGSHQS